MARKAATKNDINRGTLDKLDDKFKGLSANEKIAAVSVAIVASPLLLAGLALSLLAIGARHLTKNAGRVGQEIGGKAVHYAKNTADTLQSWKETRLEKFLQDISKEGKEYRGSTSQRYTVPDERRKFAEAYKDNPLIIYAIQEEIAKKGYLRIEVEDKKIDITKSDCKTFEEKAISKRGSDREDFHALINKLSNVVKDDTLWEKVKERASEMKKPDPNQLNNPNASQVAGPGVGKS